MHKLHDILNFVVNCPHPNSRIVGVDHYDFNAQDGTKRQWQSYTLIPVNEADRIPPYDRWYVVDLPDLGLSFVQIIQENNLPKNKTMHAALSGTGTVKTEGNGEMGTGSTSLTSFWDNSIEPPVMYASETFADGSILHFKSVPLTGLIP